MSTSSPEERPNETAQPVGSDQVPETVQESNLGGLGPDSLELGGLGLGGLGLDRGAHLLIGHALGQRAAGEVLEIRGTDPHLGVHLGPWCRAQGHALVGVEQQGAETVAHVRCGAARQQRWGNAERAGSLDPTGDGVVDNPPTTWGLAARGALVEAGGPPFDFTLLDKDAVWTDQVGQLYRQAVAQQWNPDEAVDWDAPFTLPDEVEDAVVQVMTYLIENETAALMIPARFAGRLHPHFREVLQLLAVQAADEARHIEVFTRRASLKRKELGLSTVGGQTSLKTLIDEPDFSIAALLLSVLGEGTFLNLLFFIAKCEVDPVTTQVCRLAASDEARHVAFGIAHLARHVRQDATLLGKLSAAIQQRHDALSHTSGLNAEVFDALILMAAGAFTPEAIGRGHDLVGGLLRDMDEGRQRRLRRIGFPASDAADLSALHTRNFM